MKHKRPKLYNSFLVSFLAASFLPLLLAGVLLYIPQTFELRNNTESNSENIASSVRAMLYQYMSEYDSVIKILEKIYDSHSTDIEEFRETVSGFFSAYPAIHSIELADKDGQIFFSHPDRKSPIGRDISAEKYFELYNRFFTTIWSDLVLSPEESAPMIIAARRTSFGGTLVSLSLSALSGSVEDLGENKDLLIFITDSYGNLVLRSEMNPLLEWENYKYLRSIQEAQIGVEGFFQEKINSQAYAISTKLIRSAGWVIVAGAPVSYAYKSLFMFYQTYFISFLAAFIIASIFSVVRFRKFSSSLVTLEKASDRFAGADFSVQLDSSEYEEIEKVYNSFSSMVGELHKREDDLTELNKALSISVHDKETLLAEVHHRVKNNLTVILGLLNLKLDENKDQIFRETINEIKAKIYSIANVHEQMYYSGNFSSLAFGGYIQSLAAEAARLFSGNRKIDIVIDVEEVFITVNQAVPCGLIFLEILTNAYKHAFAGREKGLIKVELKAGETIILTVCDDGVGIEDNGKKIGHMGMTIIKALVEQLAGEWEITRTPGVCHIVKFKSSVVT